MKAGRLKNSPKFDSLRTGLGPRLKTRANLFACSSPLVNTAHFVKYFTSKCAMVKVVAVFWGINSSHL